MSRPSILFVDTYYPEAMSAAGDLDGVSFHDGTGRLLRLRFGTSDFASRAMRRVGWDAEDVIANAEPLQAEWRRSRGLPDFLGKATVVHQAAAIGAAAVAFQNVNWTPPEVLTQIRDRGILVVGFCSYEPSPDVPWRLYDVVFTSFPHFVRRYGGETRFEFLALAFDPHVLAELGHPPSRDLEATFVGGLGNRQVWARGTDALSVLAREIPAFSWWGYGENAVDGALRSAWRGRAWGAEMLRLYLRSKIVVNRHGEISGGFANNMRLYEGTACGALLVTEWAPNIEDLFSQDEVVTYRGPDDLVAKVSHFLEHEGSRLSIAASGRSATLSRHKYDDRAREIDRILRPLVERRRP